MPQRIRKHHHTPKPLKMCFFPARRGNQIVDERVEQQKQVGIYDNKDP